MKRINHKYLYVALLLSNFVVADDLINYFNDVLDNEKISFNQCIVEEGLLPENRHNTNCMLTERANRALYIIGKEFKNNVHARKAFMFPDFTSYQKVSENRKNLRYPSQMMMEGKMGYVILNFDITAEGKTENISVEESWCGNLHSPFAKFELCDGFNKSAIRWAKTIKYKPATYKGSNIAVKNAKHRTSFMFDGAQLQIGSKSLIRKYERVLNQIKNKYFDSATEIAMENKKYENEFLFELARIKFLQKNYKDSITYLNEFISKVENEKDEIPEAMLVGAVSIMIESLYSLQDYQSIIELSKKIDQYLRDKKPFESVLAISYLYIGASYVNLSDVETGLFYLTRSKRMSKNEGQIEYIQNYINNVTNYL